MARGGPRVGLVRDGSMDFFSAHGFADIATRTPITEDTVFRIASITKTFTAIAVMQLMEKGLVDLDAPANDYLRAYQLVPADPGWRPATVRHLLTHTAGIAEQVPRSAALRRDFGVTVPMGRPVPTLAEHYRRRVRVDPEPGSRFRTPPTARRPSGRRRGRERPASGPVRARARLPAARHDLHRPPPIRGCPVACGDRLRAPRPRGQGRGPSAGSVTAAAGAAYSGPRDMARYLAALLGGGTNEHGSVLAPATLATMFEPQYRPIHGWQVWALRSSASPPEVT